MSVCGDTRPRFVVITNAPGLFGGGLAKRWEYAILPRKYRPLMKVKSSPSGTPAGWRRRTARSNLAASLSKNPARLPLQRAGESRKIREADIGVFVAKFM